MAHLEVDRRDNVLLVTMNRPEAKNALSGEMVVGLADAWQELEDNPEIRVAILTGAGGTFCAGADLKSMNAAQGESDHADRMRNDAGIAWRGLLRHNVPSKPIIAAVEGFAVAGGTEILQGTDIRIAGESAIFGVVEATRALFPLGGSTVRLRRQIGYTKAAEILLTGRRVSAAEAERIGLIGHVVPDGQALDKALEIAGAIAANGPLAVQAIKRSLQATEGLPEAEALKIELEIGLPIFGTEDAKEGTRAFKEKRPANYVGR